MGNKMLYSAVVVLFIFSAVFSVVLYQQQKNTRAAIEKINTLQVNLPDALQRKCEEAFVARSNETFAGISKENRKQITQATKEISDAAKVFSGTSSATFAEIRQGNRKQIEQATKEISDAAKVFSGTLSATFAEIKKANQTQVEQATKEISALARQKIIGNETAAREAYEKAQEYVSKGDFAMARLYCLNAINHAPNKKAYFETLISIDKSKGTPSTQAELDAIRSVLELGLYQVDSRDIPAMVEMLAYVNGQLKDISEKAAESQKREEQRKCAEALASLKEDGQYAWDKVAGGTPESSIDSIRERLAVLESLSSVELSSDDAAFCREETKKSNVLLGYLAAMLTIDNALSKAEKLLEASDPQFPAISSMVQTGNNVLSQLWNIDFALLPGDARGKVIAQADRIAKIEKTFNRKKSAPAMAEINRIYQWLNGDLGGNCTQKIDTLQDGMKNIMALLPEIYDLDCRRDVEKKIGDLAEKVKKYSKERYKGYQEWAVKKCKDAFKLYRSWTRVDEADAVQVIEKHLLEIDPALLNPAVARLYQDVLSKQFAEMGWKKIAKMESKLATSTKKTLEDCPNE